MFKFLKLSQKEKTEFYKFKFEYFKNFNRNTIAVVVFASMLYYVSDCIGAGGINYNTLLPRLSVIFPFIIFMLLYPRLRGYKLRMILSHLVGHLILWHTVWAIHYIDDRTYIYAGFITIDFVIMVLGYASPFNIGVISQCMIIIDLLLSNLLLDYEDLNMILATNVPFVLGIVIIQLVLTKTLYDFYVDKTRLEKLSYTDQLTGVFNRNKMKELSCSDFLMIDDYDCASIAIMDIDFFKRVNDTYGHDIGDEVLKKLTKIVSKNIDDSCLLIRWGGEEFLLIMYGFDEEAALRKCNNIRSEVEASTDSIKITISVGVAEVFSEEYKKVIVKADKALYFSKEHGRNQVTCYSDLHKEVLKDGIQV